MHSNLEQIADHWNNGQALQAGRLIFDNIPSVARPRWAARVLRLYLRYTGVDPSKFSNVLQTAENPDLWKNGHDVFDELRRAVLSLQELQKSVGLTRDQVVFAGALNLSELVAKVTYNASNPIDEFDEDSGWWIAAFLRSYVDLNPENRNLWREAWSVLVDEL